MPAGVPAPENVAATGEDANWGGQVTAGAGLISG